MGSLDGGVHVPKVTLEVPEEVAQLLRVLKAKLRREAEAGKSFGEEDPDGALKAIDEAAEALQRDAKRRCLCPHSHEGRARPAPLFSWTSRAQHGRPAERRSIARRAPSLRSPYSRNG